jgi:hypothetical protein
MARNRYSALLYLVLVFASGILVGVVSHRLYVTSSVSATVQQPRSMDEVRKKYLADMRARVGVDDQQVASVNRILDDTKRKFDELTKKEKPLHDAIQQDQIESINALLNAKQQVAYEQWRAERARLHAEAQKKKERERSGK